MNEQLMEAAVLMAVGMTVVFAFLSLLIGGIYTITAIHSYLPTEKPSAVKSASKLVSRTNNSIEISPQIETAIQTAINAHRQQSSKSS
mgnify:CR=1 FL=1